MRSIVGRAPPGLPAGPCQPSRTDEGSRFPGGPEDPDLQLVEVRIDEAEYWNVKENKLLQLLKMGKAAATGQRPRKLGEHEEVKFH
jgi:hypothetical protein